jgi:hypothetical protein
MMLKVWGWMLDSEYFSIQPDDSTDVYDVSHSALFILVSPPTAIFWSS